MKIYTRKGDDGTTGLFNSSRLLKNDPIIEAIGTVDELNAWFGMIVSSLNELEAEFGEQILTIQCELFDLGAYLCGASSPIHDEATCRLEKQIDKMSLYLTPLREFILPGGGELASRFHLARAICRRLERILVVIQKPMSYINRLSDWLFIAARLASMKQQQIERTWKQTKKIG